MKKNYKKKKLNEGDYINYIPNMVKNKFKRENYPYLFDELDRWDKEKEKIHGKIHIDDFT